jgi:hypothetical protein
MNKLLLFKFVNLFKIIINHKLSVLSQEEKGKLNLFSSF